MRSIKDLLSSFKVKISPERELMKVIKQFFKEKGVRVSDLVSLSLKGKTIKVMGDPYISYYVKTNGEEIISYLKTRLQFNVEKIE